MNGYGSGRTVRFATFNASLNRGTQGALVTDLSTPDNAQAHNVAETIQRVNPDILLMPGMSFHRNRWKVRTARVSIGNLERTTMPYWPGKKP